MAIDTEQAPLDQFLSKTSKSVNCDQYPFMYASTKLKGHNKKSIGTKAHTHTLPPSINPVFSAANSQVSYLNPMDSWLLPFPTLEKRTPFPKLASHTPTQIHAPQPIPKVEKRNVLCSLSPLPKFLPRILRQVPREDDTRENPRGEN